MTEADLKVVDLHKSFGAHEVIKGVSLEAQKGDVIAILGASGSGKSTFLRCINLLETPNSGDVYLGGEKMRMTRNRH
ncbi:MAG: ATP-binding cassette domain-containing protein, partial [Paracoccaceae bacterium]